MIPPSTDKTPATIPATIPTSSSPETFFAAIAARITGRIPTNLLNTSSIGLSPGNLLRANANAIAMKPGMEASIMPRTLIRFHTLPCSELPSDEPRTGIYFKSHSVAKAEMKAIARVRLVVPVVPDADITFAPSERASAMDVPPVPASGIRFSAAALIDALFTFLGSQLKRIMPSIFPS